MDIKKSEITLLDQRAWHTLTSAIINSAKPTDALTKLMNAQRKSARELFFDELEKHGGVVDHAGLSEILEGAYIPNVLIAMTRGEQSYYPKFQFKGNKLIAHLEAVLTELPEGLSGVAQSSFLLCKMTLPDGTTRSPLDVLRSDEPSTIVLDYIMNEAALFGQMH